MLRILEAVAEIFTFFMHFHIGKICLDSVVTGHRALKYINESE